MIITRVRLQEEHPMQQGVSTWPLPYVDLELNPFSGENGYLITDSIGLDPPNLIPIVVGFDSNGVPIFENTSDKREIALKIGLKPGIGQTYGSLRDNLYKLISRSIMISLMNGSTTIAQVSGSITKCESGLFSNKPYVVLTLECITGDFYSPVNVSIPTTELDTSQPKITYENGTAPTGLDLQFTVTSPVASFSFSNYGKFWYSGTSGLSTLFQVTYSFLAGDVVTLKTHPKEKKINLLRSAINYDLAGYINSGAVWPKLFSGVNAFDWTILSTWATINSASYTPRYWGV